MREIIIAVSFREFVGDYNSEVQELFLEHIKNQTYQNYKLVVTNFREKNVEHALKLSGVKYIFHQSQYDVWFCWTEIITNTFKHLENGKQIVLWTNADNLFDPNFFQEINNHFEPKTGGVSFPGMFYYNIEDYKNKRPNEFYDYKLNAINTPYEKRIPVTSFSQYDPTLFVPECAYIDGDLLMPKKIQQLYLNHHIMGRPSGMTHYYMFMFFAKKLKNLLFVSNVHVLESSRVPHGSREKEADQKQLDAHTQMIKENIADQYKNEEISIDFYKKAHLDRKSWIHPIFTPAKLRFNIYFEPVGSLRQKALYYLYIARHSIKPRANRPWILMRGIKGVKQLILRKWQRNP
jgi:hypothetical protein